MYMVAWMELQVLIWGFKYEMWKAIHLPAWKISSYACGLWKSGRRFLAPPEEIGILAMEFIRSGFYLSFCNGNKKLDADMYRTLDV